MLLLIGLFTHPVAILLAGEMAVGYFIVHAPLGFFPSVNGGDAAILFCSIFLGAKLRHLFGQSTPRTRRNWS